MINRDNMLEQTRRMTSQRTCFDRVAGADMSADGEIEGSPERGGEKCTIIKNH